MKKKISTTQYTRFVAIILCMLMVFLLPACSNPSRDDPPKPETEEITYPADFVKKFLYYGNIDTPKKVAQDFKNGGSKYATDAYAKPDGSVVVVVTERQRLAYIKYNDKRMDLDEFVQESPKYYHYTLNEEGTELSFWADKRLSPVAGSSLLYAVPRCSGYNYYMKHHTGKWDMLITAYNCHTNQLIHQYHVSEGWQMSMDELGE